MSVYIDGGKLINSVLDNPLLTEDFKQTFSSVVYGATKEDVAPVVHAHWDKCADFKYMCSFCGEIAPYESNYYGDVTYSEEYPYCHYCGAKMDEKKGEKR